MAKMFYTLKEAAQKLGTDEQAVTDLIANGKLNKFNDGGQSVLKRDQIDALAGKTKGAKEAAPKPADDKSGASSGSSIIELADDENSASGAKSAPADSAEISLDLDDSTSDKPAIKNDSSGSASSLLSLDDSNAASGTDAIDLNDESAPGSNAKSDPDKSGVDVFDKEEIDAANTMAQTQVSDIEGDDLNLESVGSGSGSGLLDLTQESDDTSLGADLLDEIYPGSDDSKSGESIGGSVFGSGIGGSGFGELGQEQDIEPEELGTGAGPVMHSGPAYDPAGSGFVGGMALGSIIALIVGLVVTIAAIANHTGPLTKSISSSLQYLGIWCIGLLILSIILAFVGRTIGKAMAR